MHCCQDERQRTWAVARETARETPNRELGIFFPPCKCQLLEQRLRETVKSCSLDTAKPHQPRSWATSSNLALLWWGEWAKWVAAKVVSTLFYPIALGKSFKNYLATEIAQLNSTNEQLMSEITTVAILPDLFLPSAIISGDWSLKMELFLQSSSVPSVPRTKEKEYLKWVWCEQDHCKVRCFSKFPRRYH